MKSILRSLTFFLCIALLVGYAYAADKSKKPSVQISPTIDGKQTNLFEWAKAGYEDDQDDNSGAMHNPNDIIKALYYGSNNENLFFRIDWYGDLSKKLKSDTFVCIYLVRDKAEVVSSTTRFTKSGKEATVLGFNPEFEIMINFKELSGLGEVSAVLSQAKGDNQWVEKGKVGLAVLGSLIEIKLPLAEIGLEKEGSVKLKVVAGENGMDKDVVPNDKSVESIIVFK